MENVIRELSDKVKKHLNKIDIHEQLKKDLQNEVDRTIELESKIKAERQLMITIKAIEYHKGCAKAYDKSRSLIEKTLMGQN